MTTNINELIKKHCPNGVEFKTIETLFEIKNGYTPSKSNLEYWENGVIPWFRLEDIRQNGRILADSIQHITSQAVKTLFPANSLIISTSATIGEYALVTVDFLANQRFTCLSLRKKLADDCDMMFFRYYADKISEWCRQNVNPGKFLSVDMNQFRKLRLPVPPLPVQREIVRILDKFTKLETELETELEARRKQYEYYRERLFFDSGVKMGGGGKIACLKETRCLLINTIGNLSL